MEVLKLFNQKKISHFIKKRAGEVKFGEKVHFVENLKALNDHPAKFVLLGIPEDIGVKANHGRAGTSGAWQTCLNSLLNIQENEFTHPGTLILLGEINCEAQMQRSHNIDESDPNYYAKLGDLVKEIDEKVSQVIQAIISAGKVPVIIGGGHNNAYGIIKGTSLALGKPINILNLDAHTDLRKTDHRHSGNGFSFALQEGFLHNYGIFGLSQHYTPRYIFDEINETEHIDFQLFEDFIGRESEKILSAFSEMLVFVRSADFGLEIDCDVIKDFPTSAQSPSGFSLEQIRSFIQIAARLEECRYLHLCEAAPDEANENLVGKALAFLISDFQNSKYGI